jgi:uncharacterized protein (DUF2237 family)
MNAADEQLNVFAEPLHECSCRPLTGWWRDGRCVSDATDVGLHIVCARMTAEFLQFSAERGNDLSTPQEAYGFPGLKPGDDWCLCAMRWQEALDAGAAPHVRLQSTSIAVLEVLDIGDLREHALDLM